MDTRIEELADCILERCKSYTKSPGYDDKNETYREVARRAHDILIALDGYRERHPDEY